MPHSSQGPIAADPRVRSIAPQGSLRLKIFYKILPTISTFFRERRMRRLVSLVNIQPGMRVLDLGGTPAIWEHVTVPLDITLLNLPSRTDETLRASLQTQRLAHHKFRPVEGDACNVVQFDAGAFDLVFSNSVIEHVGPEDKQAAFAREVQRLGKSYWVQTPSKWFPIEVHSGMPLYWLYPQWMRSALMRRWRQHLAPWWADDMEATRVLTRRQMTELFPNGRTRADYFFGFPKSYVSYRAGYGGTNG